MSVNAGLVKLLRERTGAGMMDCKKALVESISETHPEGDIEAAIASMRKKGQAAANKVANRIAAEGVIITALATNKRHAVMVEINSETDFVARDENFTRFVDKVAATLLADANIIDLDALNNSSLISGSQSVEQARQELVAKIGENVQIRRFMRLTSDGVMGTYIHNSRIGVLVSLQGGDESLAKDIAMHIAASNPMVINRDQVKKEAIDNERDIFTAQARESGKPEEIIEKMIEGRINKYIDEVSLLGQSFVKDPNKKISQLLKENNAEVIAFIRYEVGEGIEKKVDNFVEEVMAQART